jgi:hypothetical protein
VLVRVSIGPVDGELPVVHCAVEPTVQLATEEIGCGKIKLACGTPPASTNEPVNQRSDRSFRSSVKAST